MNPETHHPESLLTLAEAGDRLSLSTRAVYRLIARGELPQPIKVGGASRLLESDLTTLIQKLKEKRK